MIFSNMNFDCEYFNLKAVGIVLTVDVVYCESINPFSFRKKMHFMWF